jgi:hypothetical protein
MFCCSCLVLLSSILPSVSVQCQSLADKGIARPSVAAADSGAVTNSVSRESLWYVDTVEVPECAVANGQQHVAVDDVVHMCNYAACCCILFHYSRVLTCLIATKAAASTEGTAAGRTQCSSIATGDLQDDQENSATSDSELSTPAERPT